MWRDVGINVRQELIENTVKAQLARDRAFKGTWFGDPTDTLYDPDGMMWRLLGPGGINDYWRHPEFDQLGNEARYSLDKELRRRNYQQMTNLLLEYVPSIPLMRPNEIYGVANYLDWKPYGNQQFELRGFNLKVKT